MAKRPIVIVNVIARTTAKGVENAELEQNRVLAKNRGVW